MIDLPPTHSQTIEAIAQCGIPASKVRIIYEEELQLDTVEIDELSEAPSEVLMTCIYRATIPLGYYVQFANSDQNGLFWNWTRDEAGRRARLEGQQWLRDRGLLDGLPAYRPGEAALPDFAREVEAHCSVQPGSALEVINDGLITVQAGFMQSVIRSTVARDEFTCLTNALSASNLEGGIQFGFVANESDSEEGDSQ